MFFKKIKNKLNFLLVLFIIPQMVFAYSDYLIPGGENIGIELKSSGILVVGTYDIGNVNPAKEAGLLVGDKITKINNTEIIDIDDMLKKIESANNKENILITYQRANKEYITTLNLVKADNTYKTGLYVKDSITGVGTLTYIDPSTKLFGALGHEIIEKASGQKLEITDGKIFASNVTGVTRSSIGKPGEKNAKYDSSNIFGNILENTTSGIFGKYTANLPGKKKYKVAQKEDINLGKASIFTVISDNKVEEFTINIIKINEKDNYAKNLLFEITDDKLLEATGGIIQGMSGSPIIQNDSIIGAVTHVVVDDPTKGYGIFITKMLEESEN